MIKGEKVKFRKSNNIVSRLYLTSVIDRTSASVLPVVWSETKARSEKFILIFTERELSEHVTVM